MTLLPLQAWGIGDIIFEQSLIQSFIDSGYNNIVWGVESHYVEGLNRAYPHIHFIDHRLLNIDYNRRDQYKIHDALVLPLRWADALLNVPYSECMKAKYSLYGMDWQIWREHAMWQRDRVRENQLFDELNIKGDYNLINTNFQTNAKGQVPITVDNGLQNVYMRTLPGYSLFDWAKVLIKATTIHTVSTSIIYMLELLNLSAKEVHIYPRFPERHLKNVEYIFTKDYVLHV